MLACHRIVDYNKGGVSIGLGSEGIVAFVGLLWCPVRNRGHLCLQSSSGRFSSVAKPGEEQARTISPRELKIEKYASGSIGTLLLCLALLTEAIAIPGLVKHEKPDSSNASLVISASALVIMVFIWLPKRYLAGNSTAASCKARRLAPSRGVVGGRCDLAGVGLLFAKQGYEMIQWSAIRSSMAGAARHARRMESQRRRRWGERYRDLCDCCAEKPECAAADDCQCPTNAERTCCTPRADQEKCCTHKMVLANPRVEIANTNAAPDACCLEGNSNCCAIGRDSAENATVSGPGPVLPQILGRRLSTRDCAQDACCREIETDTDEATPSEPPCADACCR
ncbi:hypothetical protein B0H14DRAFT_3460962 [Mycena olivaceomarginata]|nr:hypothetical protein B0H14DRAFT_3460962 [Mycena olivaceomarginata]